MSNLQQWLAFGRAKEVIIKILQLTCTFTMKIKINPVINSYLESAVCVWNQELKFIGWQYSKLLPSLTIKK